MARLDVLDPLRGFKFQIEVDGFAAGGFDEVTGLERTTEVTEHSQGNDSGTPKKLRGRTKFGNITFKRGQFGNSTVGTEFYSWAEDVYDPITGIGVPNYRRDFAVVQYNEQNVEVKRWNVVEGWPTKFIPATNLKGDSTEKSVEELEVTNEGWTLEGS